MKANIKIRLWLLLLLTASILSSYAKNIRPEKIPVKKHFSSQQNNSAVDFLRGFFKWYRTKFEYLDHHIQYVDAGYKSNTPYRVNFHETERYLSILKSSDFFSNNYINHARSYFKQIDLALQQTKQSDGDVNGLDYDFMMHSKDTKPLFDDLDKITLTAINTTPGGATIKVQTPFNQDSYLLYYLTRIGDRYLIDKIDFLIGGVVQK
jgi:hypothetical protein